MLRNGGSLRVVGTGYLPVVHTTPEAMTCIKTSQLLFHLVEPVTEEWLHRQNRSARSLRHCYAVGKDRMASYEEMIAEVLGALRQGKRVCWALYGHGGVFAYPPQEAVRRARVEGFNAMILPGISAESCLYADLEIDSCTGAQTFEATDFLIRRRKTDISSDLILWQVGAIGIYDYKKSGKAWNVAGLELLSRVLTKLYRPDHRAIVYEARTFPFCDPIIKAIKLTDLARTDVTTASTLYIPAAQQAPINRRVMRQLNAIFQ